MDVEIRYIDAIKGKGLFALKDFPEGAIIFEEEPLVCCQCSWNRTYNYLACDHCLKPLETTEENVRRLTGKPGLTIPFPECCITDKTKHTSCQACGIRYCSDMCLNAAYNQYHRTLCQQSPNADSHPLNILENAWKQTHYPPETSTVMLIPRILATIHQSANREEILGKFLQFCHRAVNDEEELAHKFLGDNFAMQLDQFYTFLVQAVPHEGVEQLLTPDGFKSLVALIATNGQGVGTSPLAQWVKASSELPLEGNEKVILDSFIDKVYADIDETTGPFLNSEGVALYHLQSACNHSCLHNAEASFLHNNSRLSLVAVRDIKAGEEISINYLDECTIERSRHTRHKLLSQYYLFVCKCPKCLEQAEDPDCTSEEEEEEEEMSE